MPDEESVQALVEWPDDDLWPQAGYANAFFINHTAWDFTIRVGQVMLPRFSEAQLRGKKAVKVEALPVARFTVPPQAMRQLAEALNDQLSKYQERYGEIPELKDEETEDDTEEN